MLMQPYLIKILLSNIDTKSEPLKVAVLRNIEFVVDQLGCSLEQHLKDILVAVINTYPRSQLHFKGHQLPIRYGFFQSAANTAQSPTN